MMLMPPQESRPAISANAKLAKSVRAMDEEKRKPR